MKSCWKWLAFGVMLAMACGVRAQAQSLAFQRAEHLKRGVNLSSFYAQTRDLSQARLDAYMTTTDMQALKAMGFDHVRLSINPELLIAEPQTGRLRVGPMAQLDKTVEQLTDAGLNVILDIHAEETWKAALTHGDDGEARLFAFWLEFAGHYAKSDPERVYFEIMNEPSMDDMYRWEGIQDGLLAMEPVRDDNVIYTFHDYDPMWFTHQGATWSTEAWAYLHGVPYPSTPENIQAVLAQEPDERVRLQLERYGEDRWGPQRVEAEIAAVAQWAKQRGVPLYCGEFGVYKNYSDPKMRAAWINDTRTALEANRIGWAMWDYDGNFGLATKGSDGIVVDQAVLHALGMGK